MKSELHVRYALALAGALTTRERDDTTLTLHTEPCQLDDKLKSLLQKLLVFTCQEKVFRPLLIGVRCL